MTSVQNVLGGSHHASREKQTCWELGSWRDGELRIERGEGRVEMISGSVLVVEFVWREVVGVAAPYKADELR
jgi:hypothetical protein